MDTNSFFKITYGLYAVCSVADHQLNGYISNTVMQITSDPITIATSCSKNNFTHNMIQKSGIFSVSVIDQEDRHNVIGTFGYKSGKEANKFADFKYKIGQTGAPILLDDSLAWFECKVIQQIDAITHTIFIGEVIDCATENNSLVPMTYTYYREVKKGKSPKNAPTCIAHDPETAVKQGEKWICSVCGYEYDATIGDPDNGIAAGTRFEDLPDNWLCPLCSVSKNKFFKKETTMETKQDIWVCNVCGYEYDPAAGDPESGIAPGTAFEDIPDDWTCPLCGVGKSDFSKK